MSELSHNDDPTELDAFNQEAFIKNIAEIIKQCKPPKGIAINGYWGCGKTSALIQIHKELTGQLPHDYKRGSSDVIPIWFEAWRYQNENQPIVALLQEIRAQIGLWRKVGGNARKLTRIAFDSTFEMVSQATQFANLPSLDKITGAANRWESQRRETPLASQELRELMQAAISQVLGKGSDKRLVILIDDLDRCTPKVALQLLEGIKVYLNLNNCVLVFAMDQRQIENALKEAKIEQPHEYLEKICQDTHHLPLPSQATKTEYLLALLNDQDCLPHKNSLKTVLDTYDCLPANPRKIKILSNRLWLMLRNPALKNHLTAQTNKTRAYSLLLAVACIQTFHRLVNEQLEKNPLYIQTVVDYAKTPDPANPLHKPMEDLQPSFDGDKQLPVNPSDSNVFRLHRLFKDLDTQAPIIEDELKPYLGKPL
jgi:hypothetical protein